jgi:Ubiquitin-activating enzyme active site/ThiF family
MLDNVIARKYTDSRCLFFSKPVLESGTLGTKCNHEVVLPFRTSTYNDGKESDDNENEIAMCTLRSFPYLPLHCIEFAKQAYFSDYFCFAPDQYEMFRKDSASFFEQLDTMEPGEQLKTLRMIDFFVSLQKEVGVKIDFQACVRIAFDRMVDDFSSSILNLCYAADQMEESTGKKFWTGTKRRPRAIEWMGKSSAPELFEYLYCTANLYAVIWGTDPIRDRLDFEELVISLDLKQPQWSPSSEKVDLSDDDAGGTHGDEAEQAYKLRSDLSSVDVSKLQRATSHDFEKDDDSNFHIDFLTIATNLRAWNYDIKQSQRHTVKVTAGRIIPALATTTAMVCGLVDIEFCKLVLGLQNMGREKFLNSNINLAAGSGNFTTYCPDPPIEMKTGLASPLPGNFCSWDKIYIVSSTPEESVEHLVHYLESSFGVTVDRIFAFGSTEDKAVYNAVDKQKLDWDITFDDEGKPQVTDGVFQLWPQIKMAVQMLSRLQPSSAQRKVFENQVDNVKRALDNAKASFADTFQGPVSAAYRAAYEPEDEKEKEYFEAVFSGSDYVKLGVHCHTDDQEDIHLPCIKYTYREGNVDAEKDVKRLKIGS